MSAISIAAPGRPSVASVAVALALVALVALLALGLGLGLSVGTAGAPPAVDAGGG